MTAKPSTKLRNPLPKRAPPRQSRRQFRPDRNSPSGRRRRSVLPPSEQRGENFQPSLEADRRRSSPAANKFPRQFQLRTLTSPLQAAARTTLERRAPPIRQSPG